MKHSRDLLVDFAGDFLVYLFGDFLGDFLVNFDENFMENFLRNFLIDLWKTCR